MKLFCTSITVRSAADSRTTVEAEFILSVPPSSKELGSMIGKTVTLLTDGPIDIVKADKAGRSRCFYCAQLNEPKDIECRKCGGPLEA